MACLLFQSKTAVYFRRIGVSWQVVNFHFPKLCAMMRVAFHLEWKIFPSESSPVPLAISGLNQQRQFSINLLIGQSVNNLSTAFPLHGGGVRINFDIKKMVPQEQFRTKMILAAFRCQIVWHREGARFQQAYWKLKTRQFANKFDLTVGCERLHRGTPLPFQQLRPTASGRLSAG